MGRSDCSFERRYLLDFMKIVDVQAFNNVEQAMKYVAIKRYGYTKELQLFGEDVINSMKSAGFLNIGWTKEEETFSATKLLQDYVKNVFGKISFGEKLKFFMNRIFGNN